MNNTIKKDDLNLASLIYEAKNYVSDDSDKIIGKYLEQKLAAKNPSDTIIGLYLPDALVQTSNFERGYLIEKRTTKSRHIGKLKLWNYDVDERIIKVRSFFSDADKSAYEDYTKDSSKKVHLTFYDQSYESCLDDMVEGLDNLTGLKVIIHYTYEL